MILKTVGDLRKLIADLPDDMEIYGEFGPDITDVITDYANDSPQANEFYGAVEARCDDVTRLYLGVDGSLSVDDDDQESGEDDEDEDDEENAPR